MTVGRECVRWPRNKCGVTVGGVYKVTPQQVRGDSREGVYKVAPQQVRGDSREACKVIPERGPG